MKTLDDLADLAADELLEILPQDSLSPERADAVIMAARAHWFEDEQSEATSASGGAAPVAVGRSAEGR